MKKTFYLLIGIILLAGCSSLHESPGEVTPYSLHSSNLVTLLPVEEQETKLTDFLLKHEKQCDEQDKIRYLLSTLKDSHMTFLRNGESYDSSAASRWLRWKMVHPQYKDDPILTARDFVDRVTGHSNKTGVPYQVRLRDGRYYRVQTVLSRELDLLEAALQSRVYNEQAAPHPSLKLKEKAPAAPAALLLPAAAVMPAAKK